MPQPKSSRLTFQTKATQTTPIDKIEAFESALKDVVWYLGEDEAVRVAVTQWDKLLRQVPPQQLVQAAQTLVQQLGVETAAVAVARSPRVLTALPQTFYTTISALEEILGGMDDVLVAVVQKPTILLVSPPHPPPPPHAYWVAVGFGLLFGCPLSIVPTFPGFPESARTVGPSQ